MKKEIKVSKEFVEKRLDVFLSECFKKSFSRSQIQELIKKGNVKVNSQNVRPSYKVKEGEIITLDYQEKNTTLLPFPVKVEILYEDEWFLVVNKPAGLLTHPTPKEKERTLVNALLYLSKKLSTVDPLRLGIVHRLDKDTSGVMVIAKDNFVHLKLREMFSEHNIEREYLALVEGILKIKEGKISLPLAHSKDKFTQIKVSFLKSKRAVTLYKVLKELEKVSLVLVKPLTGRTHQIRVHFKFLGHPIIGDKKYSDIKAKRMCLHARSLGFLHPITNRKMEFKTPIPSDFREVFLSFV